MNKTKFEWSATLICEIVFGLIGTIFTGFGVGFFFVMRSMGESSDLGGVEWIFPLVFGGIGVAFLIVFGVLLYLSAKRKASRRRLIASGSFVNAQVTEIKRDHFVEINGRNPYYVICQGRNPYTGEMVSFRSGNITENPAPLSGQYRRVFVDFKNPETYYVELDRDYDD